MIRTIIKQSAFWLVGTTAFALTSCDKTPHEKPNDIPQQGTSITVGINTDEAPDLPLNDVHLYFFDESETLAKHTYYPTMKTLALDRILLDSGYYTIFAVLNTEESLVPASAKASGLPALSFSEFSTWVKNIDESAYPHMATGMIRRQVDKDTGLVIIDIKKGSGAVGSSTVTLKMAFPSANLPDFEPVNRANAADAPSLRAIIEIYKQGTDECLLRKSEFITPTTTAGVYTSNLMLSAGIYDLRIWADYTSDVFTDNHYTTSDTRNISILDKDKYVANTDTRDAYTIASTLSVGDGDSSVDITMHRPLAKYRIVATDVAKYNEQQAKKGYPALNDLRITVSYEGFLPSAYNVKTQKPSDAATGYRYTSQLSEQGQDRATVGKDYILVNGEQSFVTVTLLFSDASGKTISGTKGIKIDYRAGQLTTVSGEFLTAGLSGAGVHVDTDWEDDDYEIIF